MPQHRVEKPRPLPKTTAPSYIVKQIMTMVMPSFYNMYLYEIFACAKTFLSSFGDRCCSGHKSSVFFSDVALNFVYWHNFIHTVHTDVLQKSLLWLSRRVDRNVQ